MSQTADELAMSYTYEAEATKFIPQGFVTHDSVRGSMFWERTMMEDSQHLDTSTEASPTTNPSKPVAHNTDHDNDPSHTAQEVASKVWGKPFQLDWISTTAVPFYRVRGLRNAWNANREVKIARDGTELEPTVGMMLTALFHGGMGPASCVNCRRFGGGGGGGEKLGESRGKLEDGLE